MAGLGSDPENQKHEHSDVWGVEPEKLFDLNAVCRNTQFSSTEETISICPEAERNNRLQLSPS